MSSTGGSGFVTATTTALLLVSSVAAEYWFTYRKAQGLPLLPTFGYDDNSEKQASPSSPASKSSHGDDDDEDDDDADDERTRNSKVKLPLPQSVLTLIQQRRSFFPRQFTGKPVSPLVIDDMLEAARWAPTHHLIQPWHFLVLESGYDRRELGQLLARLDKDACERSGKPFVMAKCEKVPHALAASHIIAICCSIKSKMNPLVEDILSVAMAVQNMQLVATSHDSVGAYWSSSGVYDPNVTTTNNSNSNKAGSESSSSSLQQLALGNPPALLEFLGLAPSDFLCLGWLFVGDISNLSAWPKGRRRPCSVAHFQDMEHGHLNNYNGVVADHDVSTVASPTSAARRRRDELPVPIVANRGGGGRQRRAVSSGNSVISRPAKPQPRSTTTTICISDHRSDVSPISVSTNHL